MNIRGFSYKMNNLNIQDLLFIENNKDKKFKIFIYNFLKSEFSRSDIFNNPDCFFFGERTTTSNYTMYDLGDYPIMSDLEPSDYPIKGELYEVNSEILLYLDKIHHICNRTEIELTDGTICESYIASIKLNNKKILPDIDNSLSWRIKNDSKRS